MRPRATIQGAAGPPVTRWDSGCHLLSRPGCAGGQATSQLPQHQGHAEATVPKGSSCAPGRPCALSGTFGVSPVPWWVEAQMLSAPCGGRTPHMIWPQVPPCRVEDPQGTRCSDVHFPAESEVRRAAAPRELAPPLLSTRDRCRSRQHGHSSSRALPGPGGRVHRAPTRTPVHPCGRSPRRGWGRGGQGQGGDLGVLRGPVASARAPRDIWGRPHERSCSEGLQSTHYEPGDPVPKPQWESPAQEGGQGARRPPAPTAAL